MTDSTLDWKRRSERTVHATFGAPLCFVILATMVISYLPSLPEVKWTLERLLGTAVECIHLGFVTLLLLTAAYTDCTRTKIYNWLTYPTIVWGLLWAAFSTLQTTELQDAGLQGLGLQGLGLFNVGIGQALIGSIGCGLLMLVPYSLSRGGAGDVKLAAALGALIGFELAFWSLAGGYICAAIFIVARKAWLRIQKLISRPKDFSPSAVVTLGLAIGIAWSKPVRQLNATKPDGVPSQPLKDAVPMAGFFAIGATIVLAGSLL